MDYYEMFKPGALPAVKPLDERWYEEEVAKDAPKSTVGEMLGPAIRTTAASRLGEIAATTIYRPEADPTWEMSEDVNKELNREYDKESADYIREATSQADFYFRKTVMDDHRRDREILARGGLTGIGLTLGAAILDPVAIGAGMLTGSTSYITKATGISRIARGALMAGIEIAAIEGIIASADPHYRWQDFVLNVGLGSALGGAFNIRGAKSRAVSESTEDALLKSAIDLKEASIRRNISDGKLTPGEYQGYDLNLVQRDIESKTLEIEKLIEKKVSHKQIQAEKRQLSKLEKRHASLQDDIARAKKEVEYHATKNFDEHIRLDNERVENLDNLRSEYERDFNQLQKKLDEANKRVTAIKARKKPNAKKLRKVKAARWKYGNQIEVLARRYERGVARTERMFNLGKTRADRKLQLEMDTRSDDLRKLQDAIGEQITAQRTKLDMMANAKKAPDLKKWWDSITLKERMKYLYNGNPPKKTVTPKEVTDGWVAQPTTSASAGAAASSDFPSAYTMQMRDVSNFRGWEAVGEKLPDTIAVMTTAAGRVVGSMSNFLTTSASMAMRGFASRILENPQGGFRGPTMAIYKEIEERIMRAAARGRVEPAFDGWMKLKGNNLKDTVFNPEFRDEFNRQVFKGIYDPDSITDDFVKEAADAYRDVFKTSLERMQKYGVKAFEGVTSKFNYVPRILSTMKLKQWAGQNPTLVRKVLVRGYMEGDYKLPREAAEAVADAHLNRTMDKTLTTIDGGAASNILGAEELEGALRDAGVPDDVIKILKEERIETAGELMMQDRARASMGINPMAEVEGLKVMDLLETNMPGIMDRYVKESAFDASLGRMGYSSRAELENDLQMLEKGMKNNLVNTGQSMADVEKEMQVLRDGIKMLQGRSIDSTAGTRFGKFMRRLQNYTGLVRLGQIGIATIPEAARVFATRPWYMMKDALPAFSFIGSKAQRGGTWAGKLERADWDEMDRVFQYAGDDHVLYGEGLRTEVLEEGIEDSRLGKLFDNALNYGKKLQSITSGFRLVQGSLERFSVRSIGTKIVDQAHGGKKLFTKAEIKSAGWSPETFDAILEHVRLKGGTATMDDGRVIRTLNIDEMDNELFDTFQVGVHRIANREMQRMVVGETPRYMHTALGSCLTQFRSFAIGSMEKQMLYDFKYNRGKGTLIALTSVALAGLSHGIRTNLNALGRDDAEEYVRNKMTGQNLAWGIFSGMGQLASVSPALDVLATVGLMPDDTLAAPGKTGAHAMGATSIPAIGMAGAALKTTRDVVDLITGSEDDVDLARDLRGLLPYMKVVGLQQALNTIESN